MGHSSKTDLNFMGLALKQARLAEAKGDVPVGAILVMTESQKIIAHGRNQKEEKHDPTGHAEIVTLRKAAKKLKKWRLSGCTLYVTLEPCFMCAGAIVQARLDRVVFGTRDPKGGAVCSLHSTLNDKRLNHSCEIEEGVLEHECSEILKTFFKGRREKRNY